MRWYFQPDGEDEFDIEDWELELQSTVRVTKLGLPDVSTLR